MLKALRQPRRAALYALLGAQRYRRLMADADAESRTDWLKNEIDATPEITEKFHLLSYYGGALQQTYWLGVPILKSPLDCWIYQEIISEQRPDLIIETGTDLGGSALFFASICENIGHGSIVSIDIRSAARVEHPRITFLLGDSTSDSVLERVHDLARGTERRMVVLDSDHSAEHVRRELQSYRDLVTPGSYMVVEDTNLNGHPVMPEHGPGPFEAVTAFLDENDDFEVDRSREKFLLTYFPTGYLRRVSSRSREPRSASLRPASQ